MCRGQVFEPLDSDCDFSCIASRRSHTQGDDSTRHIYEPIEEVEKLESYGFINVTRGIITLSVRPARSNAGKVAELSVVMLSSSLVTIVFYVKSSFRASFTMRNLIPTPFQPFRARFLLNNCYKGGGRACLSWSARR
jgi:hypothetical protein